MLCRKGWKNNYSFTEEMNEFCLARDFMDNSGISNVFEMWGMKNALRDIN